MNGAVTVRSVAHTITAVVRAMLSAAGAEAAWVTVRSGAGGGDPYRVPRWHTDGQYFIDDRDGAIPIKLLMTLKGAPTRLANIRPERRSECSTGLDT